MHMSKMEILRYTSGALFGFFLGVQLMKVGINDLISYIALAALVVNLVVLYKIGKLKLELLEEKKINKKFNEI